MAIAFFHFFLANFQCELKPGGQKTLIMKKKVDVAENVFDLRRQLLSSDS